MKKIITFIRHVHPILWTALSIPFVLALGLSFLIGAFAAGGDASETCAKAGQIYDEKYRSENWREPSQIFPLHNRCNADYDLVPFWINPTITLLGVVIALLLATSLISAILQHRDNRKRN